MKVTWPHGRAFALTICDDTDNGTLANLKPVYDALASNGLHTTKTVWSLPCKPDDQFWGETLSHVAYLQWVLELSRQGFEIAWHGTRSGGSTRAEIIEGIDLFRRELGAWPDTYANHANNVENIYWGLERFDNPLLRFLYARARRGQPAFQGSKPQSPHYWLDVCSERLQYVRDFTFRDIVTSEVDPWMPYHDPRRDEVRAWFSSTAAADVAKFVHLLTPTNIDRLDSSGGVCILYTHCGSGFVTNGKLDGRVAGVLRELAKRNGWYVPVRAILRHLESVSGLHTLGKRERSVLEWRWTREHSAAAVKRVFRL